MTLIGTDQSVAAMPSDGTLRIDLTWTVERQPSRRYQTVVHLVGRDGLRWSPKDSYRPAGYQDAPRTTAWFPGRYALDSHEIEPLPGTPPGTYDVVLTVFDRETLAPLSLLNEQGQPAAPELTLGQVTLTRPRRPAEPGEYGIRNRLDQTQHSWASLGPLTLLGADLDRDEAAPGDPVFITLLWRVDEHPAEELTLALELLAPGGSPAAAYDVPPAAAWHPSPAWQPGEIWRGQHLLHLPADLDSGSYTWRLALQPTYQSTSLPSTIAITAPERTYSAPAVDVGIDALLGDVATLVGATLTPGPISLAPGSSLTVALVWRAEAETDTSYRVFVHLVAAAAATGVGDQGALIAQSDAEPAGWTRPTTGWLPGEYVTDVHTLAIPDDAPAGEYRLLAGLYTPDGGRLTTPDGADAIPVATVTIAGP
jgi:hypothetical protein